jgi:hypothetical protein
VAAVGRREVTSDVSIYKAGLLQRLVDMELVVGDQGYRGNPTLVCPKVPLYRKYRECFALARARHETVNGRFKMWGCLFQEYRHDRKKHGDIFSSVVVLTQLAFENGNPPFRCYVAKDRVWDGRQLFFYRTDYAKEDEYEFSDDEDREEAKKKDEEEDIRV